MTSQQSKSLMVAGGIAAVVAAAVYRSTTTESQGKAFAKETAKAEENNLQQEAQHHHHQPQQQQEPRNPLASDITTTVNEEREENTSAAHSQIFTAEEEESDDVVDRNEFGASLTMDPLEHTLLEEQLPCSATEAFDRLFNERSSFLKRFKEGGGGSGYKESRWRRGGRGSFGLRELSFVQAVNSRLSPVSSTRVTESQRFIKLHSEGPASSTHGAESSTVALETVVQTVDVPFSDYFSTHFKWVLTSQAAAVSSLTVTCELVWVKSTWLKHQIAGNVLSEARATHTSAAELIRRITAEPLPPPTYPPEVVPAAPPPAVTAAAAGMHDNDGSVSEAPSVAVTTIDTATSSSSSSSSSSPSSLWRPAPVTASATEGAHPRPASLQPAPIESAPIASRSNAVVKNAMAAKECGWLVALLLLLLHLWGYVSPDSNTAFAAPPLPLPSDPQFYASPSGGTPPPPSFSLQGLHGNPLNYHHLMDMNAVSSQMRAIRAQATLLANAQQRLQDDMRALELLLQDLQQHPPQIQAHPYRDERGGATDHRQLPLGGGADDHAAAAAGGAGAGAEASPTA